ncbi:MAG: hypothetical protein NTX25_03170 [Proteobacteria bacterium]|nr:hypothetical protein [Pseudomonadota bacterium]
MGCLLKINIYFLWFWTLIASIAMGGESLELAKSHSKSPRKTPAITENRRPIHEWTAEQIMKNFMFVGDFEQKEDTRENSKEVFWRYPLTMPKIGFELDLDERLDSPAVLAAFPKTEGEGRAIQHLNRGRIYFLEGNFEEARKTWLSGRARYGSSYDYHRRLDYFIAQSFTYQAFNKWKANGRDYNLQDVRQNFVNSATFLSWAFDRKKDLFDPVLEQLAPRSFYNQAVIYYNYQRWAGVAGTLMNGLDFLRKAGRKEYRREMRRMKAEMHIRDRSYLEAVQELDLSLRQDEDIQSAAGIMARIGDIYFDLNNFELAEEVYSAANRIDRELRQIRPSQYILRGESLFWLGKFDEARKTMAYAQLAASLPQSIEDLDTNMQALASLRIADSWLALGNFEKAKLSYFQHSQEFRGHPTAIFADIRLACLELPEYEGNNIQHARQILAAIKDKNDTIPPPAQEMSWTCETASYAQHERTPEMVDRVREMANRYPNSALLQKLVEPVREVQVRKIDEYFASNDLYGAVQFFEKTRSFLFPVVNQNLAVKLFSAYADLNQAEKAKEFLGSFNDYKKDDHGWLQMATVLVELSDSAALPEKKKFEHSSQDLAKQMLKLDLRLNLDKSNRMYLHRILGRPNGQEHYPWILVTGLKWLESDISIGCDVVYPVLQRMQDKNKNWLDKQYESKASIFIDKSLKDLLRFETNCAYSLMEFEIGLHNQAIAALARRYLERDYIPFNPQTAAIIWNLSEQSLAQGERSSAEALWKLLSTKGSPDLPEVKFARTRLKDQPTELENLWRN